MDEPPLGHRTLLYIEKPGRAGAMFSGQGSDPVNIPEPSGDCITSKQVSVHCSLHPFCEQRRRDTLVGACGTRLQGEKLGTWVRWPF